MSLVFMMVLLCSGAMMNECVAEPQKLYRGENALQECKEHIPVFVAQNQLDTPHNLVYCEVKK